MKRRLQFSIKFILLFVVILLGALPLILMHTIINNSVRNNTHLNSTQLTQGILDQSQKYINFTLKELNSISEAISRELTLIADKTSLSEENIAEVKKNWNKSSIFGELAIINLNPEEDSLLYNGYNYKVTPSKDFKEFIKTQPVMLLKENSSRVLWLGLAPIKGFFSDSMWCYRIIKSNKSSYIIAVSINNKILSGLLKDIERATESDVRLITTDNRIIPGDNNYFNYKFAAKTLSRSDRGRFISFRDSIDRGSGEEKLLIHLYSDPLYFYNLVVLTPEKRLLKVYLTVSGTTTLTLLILTLFSIGFGVISIIFIQKRVRDLINAVDDVSRGKYSISFSASRVVFKEDYSLREAIIRMAREIKESRKSLKNMNHELERRVYERTRELKKTNSELNMTRESLIHSEKMATLGKNAAKLTHEINNSIGISITASSHLSNLIGEITDKMKNNTLTKSLFFSFAEDAEDVSRIIESNLKKASELSLDFKKFASDQSSDEIKVIQLKSYIGEIVKSCVYNLKKGSHTVELICPEEIEFKTFPVIIYQIIVNLINNSLLHGFETIKNGEITIEVWESKGFIEIKYRDNGKGISGEYMSKLYEPFFTTKPDAGGTGLGLNIIRELIEKKLKGSIECYSISGEGAEFHIKLPREI